MSAWQVHGLWSAQKNDVQGDSPERAVIREIDSFAERQKRVPHVAESKSIFGSESKGGAVWGRCGSSGRTPKRETYGFAGVQCGRNAI